MFTTPIRHTYLKSMEEVMNFSYRTGSRATPLTRWQNNGQIAFADQYGNVYVTPYRDEIHRIMEESGYKEKFIFVPFSNGEQRPDEYQWNVKIAEEENWALTYEEAAQVAQNKGIRRVMVSEKYQIKEISSFYDDTDTHTIYLPLTMKFLMNETKDNIGTYIFVDEKTLVICDEYGRTFLLRAKTVVNDIVNALLDAGYSRNIHPEMYIRKYDPKEEE